MLKLPSRFVFPLIVLVPVLFVTLAGCSAATSGNGTGTTPDSAAGLDCDAVANSFDAQAKSQGINFTYTKVDPATIIGVQGLPAETLAHGCYVSSNQKAAHSLIPITDSTTYEELATILTANGYVRDDSQNKNPETEHSFYATDKTLPSNEYEIDVFDLLAADKLGYESLPTDLFDASDGLMLYVFAGIH